MQFKHSINMSAIALAVPHVSSASVADWLISALCMFWAYGAATAEGRDKDVLLH